VFDELGDKLVMSGDELDLLKLSKKNIKSVHLF
jgi:hypothetical protein